MMFHMLERQLNRNRVCMGSFIFLFTLISNSDLPYEFLFVTWLRFNCSFQHVRAFSPYIYLYTLLYKLFCRMFFQKSLLILFLFLPELYSKILQFLNHAVHGLNLSFSCFGLNCTFQYVRNPVKGLLPIREKVPANSMDCCFLENIL